jgi:hypothetical protein
MQDRHPARRFAHCVLPLSCRHYALLSRDGCRVTLLAGTIGTAESWRNNSGLRPQRLGDAPPGSDGASPYPSSASLYGLSNPPRRRSRPRFSKLTYWLLASSHGQGAVERGRRRGRLVGGYP